jgi:hypothetical protein
MAFEALYNIAINEITSLLQEEVVNFSKIRNKKKRVWVRKWIALM